MDFIQKQNQLIEEANHYLRRVIGELDTIVESDFLSMHEEDAEIDTLRTLQLVLQYRLDSQDALQHLFQFSQSLWQYLGLSQQNSSSINIERLEFALGGEDLHHALSMLSRLIDALLRILKRYHFDKLSNLREEGIANRKRVEKLQSYKPSRLCHKMALVVEAQQSFNLVLEQLENSLEDAIEGQPQIGPIYDHIGKLEGPISHFHQAVRHGLIAAGGLYQQLEARSIYNLKLDELLHKANEVLIQPVLQPPQLVEAPRLFKPTNTIPGAQNLELRAAEKRFGYFFPHP